MSNYIIRGDSLFATLKGNPYSITSDHPQFNVLREALLNGSDDETLIGMFDRAKAATCYMNGSITSDGGSLFYKGEQIHGVAVDRILQFMSKGLPYEPIVAFLQRLYNNPSRRAVNELFSFLEKNAMPLTPDGYLLGYKGVDEEFKDQWTHKIDNSVGATPRMDRNLVDDNWMLLCSSGYHVGSKLYATGHGAKTVIVKVDPADVVSVPPGEEDWKMRVCAYEVVSEYAGELPPSITLSNDPYADESVVMGFLKRLFGKRKD